MEFKRVVGLTGGLDDRFHVIPIGALMTSTAEGSVTRWLGDLKSGGDAAAQHLWERYSTAWSACAQRLRGRGGAAEDEEDAALERLRQLLPRCGAGPISPARRPG